MNECNQNNNKWTFKKHVSSWVSLLVLLLKSVDSVLLLKLRELHAETPELDKEPCYQCSWNTKGGRRPPRLTSSPVKYLQSVRRRMYQLTLCFIKDVNRVAYMHAATNNFSFNDSRCVHLVMSYTPEWKDFQLRVWTSVKRLIQLTQYISSRSQYANLRLPYMFI